MVGSLTSVLALLLEILIGGGSWGGFVFGSAPPVAPLACTLGPYDSGDSLATIDAALDAASADAVLCLERAATWSSSGVALSFSTHHEDADRVTVCASDATVCTDSGAANPRITVTTNTSDAVSWAATGDGYTLRNLDFTNSGSPNDGSASTQAHGNLPAGLANVSILGGTYIGYASLIYVNTVSTPMPDNIRLGDCDHVVEVKDAHVSSGDQHVFYGACKNCGFSLYVHDWGEGTGSGGRTHELDFSTAATGTENQTLDSENIVVECSHFLTDNSATTGNGYQIKLAAGRNAIIRDNIFEMESGEPDGAANCAGGVNFGGHTGPPNPYAWGWDGAEVYRNAFLMKNCFGLASKVGKNINIYNNLFVHDWVAGNAYFYTAPFNIESTGCADGPSCTPAANVAFFNNTIFASEVGNGQPIILASSGTGHKFFNNVVQVATSNALISSLGSCGNWGVNGVDIHNNYVYSPNDATPTTGWSGCSAASNPATYTTDPGMADPLNTAATPVDRLKITSADTLLWKMGSSGAPAQDYLLATRPSPASIGAFDVVP